MPQYIARYPDSVRFDGFHEMSKIMGGWKLRRRRDIFFSSICDLGQDTSPSVSDRMLSSLSIARQLAQARASGSFQVASRSKSLVDARPAPLTSKHLQHAMVRRNYILYKLFFPI